MVGYPTKNTEAYVKRTRTGLLCLALAYTAASYAQDAPPQQPAQQQPAQQGTTFESLDANSDGKISKAEAAANENVSAQFSKYDQNGDGFIERSEVNNANDSQSQPNPQ